MYRNLMIPVDGSSFSEHGIPYASAIARRAQARLHIVLVHTSLARHAADVAPTHLFEQWETDHREKEARYLDGLVKRLKQLGVDAVAEKLEGDVAHTLIRRSESNIDLLVMATHGRGGLEQAWLGSVADGVVHHVRLPVLLLRPSGDGAPPTDATFEHILVATDGTESAAAATEEGVRLARLFGARLTLLRVVSVPAGLSSPYLPHAAEADRRTAERRQEEAQIFLDGLAKQLEGDIKVQTRVELAYHPARGIFDGISETGCDLVAVGTRRRTRLARIVLGSVADKIVRASPVPVLVGHA